jgi:hypothetical protein
MWISMTWKSTRGTFEAACERRRRPRRGRYTPIMEAAQYGRSLVVREMILAG